MSNTRVVNIRKESCDVYIGRAGQGKDGYFGNPFRLEATMTRGARWTVTGSISTIV